MERKPFEVLSRINVNDCTKNKNESAYLQWASAWAETKKNFPDADYTIWKDEQHRPYIFDANLGYMVFTTVTIEGETKEMWLPVLDASKNALKDKPYTVTTKKWDETVRRKVDKEVTVPAATMFDINSAIMRCLTKNLAMFGLGLYLYEGKNIPDSQPVRQEGDLFLNVLGFAQTNRLPDQWLAGCFGKGHVSDLTRAELLNVLEYKQNVLKKWDDEKHNYMN